MQQVQREGYDLDRLLMDLTGMSDGEIETEGRRYYSERFLDDAHKGLRQAHDGEVVVFRDHRFDHSCLGKPNRNCIDPPRVARLPWVLPVIEGNIANTECWSVTNEKQGRPNNRAYIVLSHNFVVWLEPRDAGGWKYSTHYTADIYAIRGYQRRGVKVWEF